MVIAPSTAVVDGEADDGDALHDQALVAAHRAGDAAAFTYIVRAHHDRLLRQARRQLGDLCDAEDAVQETLLRAYRSLHGFGVSGDWRLGAWLTRIMGNVCIDQRARREASTRLVAKIHHGEPAGADASELASDPVALAAVREAMAHLPGNQRQAFVLRAVDDLPYEAIADQLGISEANARARVQRARSALRRALERAPGSVALCALPAVLWARARWSTRWSWGIRRHWAPLRASHILGLRRLARGKEAQVAHVGRVVTSGAVHMRRASVIGPGGALRTLPPAGPASALGPASAGAGSGGASGALSIASGALPGSSATAPGASNLVSSAASGASNLVSGVASGASSLVSGAASGASSLTSGAASGALSSAAGVVSGSSSPLSSAAQLVNQLAGQVAASPAGQALLATATAGTGTGRGALMLGLAASVATAGALSFPSSSVPTSAGGIMAHPAVVGIASAPDSSPSTPATTPDITPPPTSSATGTSSTTEASTPLGSAVASGTTSAGSSPSGSGAAATSASSPGTTALPLWVSSALALASGSPGAASATNGASTPSGGSAGTGGTSGSAGSGGSGTSASGGSGTSAVVLPQGTCSGVPGFPGATSGPAPTITAHSVDQMLDTGRVDLSSAGFSPFFTAAAPLTAGDTGDPSTSSGATGNGASGATGNGASGTSSSGSTTSSSGGGSTANSADGGDGASSGAGSSDLAGGAPLQMAVGTCLATSGSVLAVDLTGPDGVEVQLVGSLLSAAAIEPPASSTSGAGGASSAEDPTPGGGGTGTAGSPSSSGGGGGSSSSTAASSTTSSTSGGGSTGSTSTSAGSGSAGSASSTSTGGSGTTAAPGSSDSAPPAADAVYLFAGVVHPYGADAADASLPWGLPDQFVARLHVERSPSSVELEVAFMGSAATGAASGSAAAEAGSGSAASTTSPAPAANATDATGSTEGTRSTGAGADG